MQFKRLIWVSTLMIALALIFAACNTGPVEPQAAEAAEEAEAPAAEAEATEAPAEEAAAEEKERLGSTLIGEIEWPSLITNVHEFPSEFE